MVSWHHCFLTRSPNATVAVSTKVVAVVVGALVVVLAVVEITDSVDLLRLLGASTTTGLGPDAEPNAPYSGDGTLFTTDVLDDCLFFLVALYLMKYTSGLLERQHRTKLEYKNKTIYKIFMFFIPNF